MPPKTITYNRTRKINPALIDPKYQYGSEEIQFGAWADVPEDADLAAETADLKSYVDGEIQAQIEALVHSLRSKTNKRNYYWQAIEAAFRELMASQKPSDDEMQIALERFTQLLEIEMSRMEF